MEESVAIALLAALAQEMRLRIFRALVGAAPRGLTPGELTQRLNVPASTLSFHLKELTAAGLIEGESRGRFICYRANFDAMNQLIEFLTRNCCGGDASQCGPTNKLPAAKARKSLTKKMKA